MTGAEIASIAKDCLVAAAASATVAIGYFGLSTWNRQLRGQADFEAARNLAKVTYKLRDEVAFSRSKLVRTHEFPDDYFAKSHSARSREEEGQAWAHVYGKRWGPVGAAVGDFEAHALEAEALWGPEARKRTNALLAPIRKLRASMEAVVQNHRNSGEDFLSDATFGKEMRANVGASSDGQDPLSREIDAAVGAIEELIRPHLRRVG